MPSGEEEVRGLSITFTSTSRHHTGIYTCSADNGFGRAINATITLDVQRKAVFLQILLKYIRFQVTKMPYQSKDQTDAPVSNVKNLSNIGCKEGEQKLNISLKNQFEELYIMGFYQ